MRTYFRSCISFILLFSFLYFSTFRLYAGESVPDVMSLCPQDESSVSAAAEEPLRGEASLPDDVESSISVSSGPELSEADAPGEAAELVEEQLVGGTDAQPPQEQPAALTDTAVRNPYRDVQDPSHPYYKAIYWARANGIANGYSGKNTFGINDPCTRGQVIRMLWNMAGKPAPGSGPNPFKDIRSSDSFYKAILWANIVGITKGYNDGTFRKDEPCTRGQIAAFLWRYYGMAEHGLKGSPFADTITSAYEKAVLWCCEKNIVKGYSDGSFRDRQTCTRGQVALMMYRSFDIPRLHIPSQGTFSAISSTVRYTGSPVCPEEIVSHRNARLVRGIDYDVEYQNNILPGSAAILIHGKGVWTGAIRRIFKIMLPVPGISSLKSSRNGQLEAAWSKCSPADGYEVRYAAGKTTKTAVVEGQTLQTTIKGVSLGTKYSVSVRSYIDVNGKRYHSAWSGTKTLTTRNMYWKVTQYASRTGNQCMAYSITDPNGRLIMVDGGWTQDADQMRSIVRVNGNHVYAWIVTHAHPDHVGALNAILSNNKTGIRIDHIYTAWIDGARYEETKKDYDGIEAYREFKRLTSGMKNVSWLKEGASFSSLGLTFKVLHAWDNEVASLKKNLCNCGSLMFMVNGEQEKMLFCADTEKVVQDSIIEKHRNDLAADYVQTAHHGNWGLTKTFYEYVHPKAAFFDSPEYIVGDTSGKYDAPALIKYFQSYGAKVYKYSSAPNTVTLR